MGGLSYVEERQFEGAKKCFASAIEFDPCARYFNNRGLASYHLQQYDEAISDFSAAIETEPDNASIHFNRGNARFRLEQHEDALVDYSEAIRLEPDNPTYLHHKGLSYQGCGNVHE